MEADNLIEGNVYIVKEKDGVEYYSKLKVLEKTKLTILVFNCDKTDMEPMRWSIDYFNATKRIVEQIREDSNLKKNNTEQIKTALAEQHRNTRHDAVEKMQEIRARYAEKYDLSICENMLNEIAGCIMNLKQRMPEIK